MRGRLPLLLPGLLLALAACEWGKIPSDDLALPPDASEAIDAAYGRYADAYETGDDGIVADLYAPDALYLPPEGEMLRGRTAVRTTFANFFQEAARQGVEPRISFRSLERRGSEAVAYDVGYYVLEFRSEDRTFATSRGKYATVWRPGDDGRWRIQVDAFNPATPPRMAGDTAASPGDTARGDTAGAGGGSEGGG